MRETGQVVLALILALGTAWAQLGELKRPTTNVPDAEFPRLNSDLSATFRVNGGQAQKLLLLMDFDSSYEMAKGDDGFWEVPCLHESISKVQVCLRVVGLEP